MKNTIVLGCVAALLAACSTTRPVAGKMERSDETFSGTVTGAGYEEGHGELRLLSSRKTQCEGSFTYTSRRRGEGVLRCDDGRSGTFQLVGANATGSGFGTLNGQRFTFTFGS